MKSCPLSLRLLYICLFLAAVCSLARPFVALASGPGSAYCGGGRSVSCSAYRCVCEDNVGCTGYDSSGNQVEDKPCPSDQWMLWE
jgi:hypothetical protein